jgi:trehalose/maltose transport system substrate-binding protein
MSMGRRLGLILLCCGLACSRKAAREPATVTFLDIEWEGPDQLTALTRDLQEFTRETGIRVNRLPAPSGSLTQLALWRELLQKGDAGPDVCGIDVIWSGMLDQYLIDLKPYFGADLSSNDPVVVASYTLGGKLVAAPRHAYVGVLMYRTDLLKRYGYTAPPKTWTELETMAARIQAGERARGDREFWGYVWQGGETEDLTCAGLEWQVGEGGGRIIEADGMISVNNPQTVRVWQRAAKWVGTISPPSVVAHEKWDAENVWRSGKTAFVRAWVSDFSLVSAPVRSPEGSPQFGVTSLPGGRSGRVGALGGNGLAVTRSSTRQREAVELIRFLLKRDFQVRRSLVNSDPPTEPVLFELPAILRPYPRIAQSMPRGGGVVARPSVVAGAKYEDVSRAYIRAAHSVLTGEVEARAAAAALEKELMEMTGFRPGRPADGLSAQ